MCKKQTDIWKCTTGT